MAKFKAITRETFLEGSKRGLALRPHALSANFDRDHHRIVIHLDTGLDLSFDPRTAFGLERANASELSEVEIVGAGGSIHFPQLDAFFSIPKLLEGFLGPLHWSRSDARAAASRENGKLGGRPKKPAEAATA
jgi:Protein of unknown function (DUF2442)